MYKYIGDGWIDGIPAKDLSEDDFKQLTKEQQELVRNSKFYQEEKKPESLKATKRHDGIRS